MSHDTDVLRSQLKSSLHQLNTRLRCFQGDSKPLIESWLHTVVMSLIDGVDLKKVDISLITSFKNNTAAFVGALDASIAQAFPRYPKFVDSLDISKDLYFMFYTVIVQFGPVIDQSFLADSNPWTKNENGGWSYNYPLNSPEFQGLYKNSGIKEYYEKVVSIEQLLADVLVLERRSDNHRIWNSIK